MASKRPKPDIHPDSVFSHDERERRAFDGSPGYVQSSADGEYGHVTGFRYGITSTGHAHKAALSRKDLRQE